MQNLLLIVFARTPEYGKVKQRLANKLGNTKALEVHQRLLDHTLAVAEKSGCLYNVYLSETPQSTLPFKYKLQTGSDLGERMNNALHTELKQYAKVCLIGSDCLAITETDIANAFEHLDSEDVVIGPAVDGGYYLIGMKKPYRQLFSGILWGESSVLENTLQKCSGMGLSVGLLRQLNDIDRPEDVPDAWL